MEFDAHRERLGLRCAHISSTSSGTPLDAQGGARLKLCLKEYGK